jgi:hypothetical protein
MNNMLMYSAEKEIMEQTGEPSREASKGIFAMAVHGSGYILQCGNAVTEGSAKILKERIDRLNALGGGDVRRILKQQLKTVNDNPESRGAGLGLTEIARRATSGIEYEFTPLADGLLYYTIRVQI